MSWLRLSGKGRSSRSYYSRLPAKVDLASPVLRRCLDLCLLIGAILFFPCIVLLLIVLFGTMFVFTSVTMFKDAMLPLMGESVKAMVIERNVTKGGDSGDSYEIVYGYKLNEHGRQVDGVWSESVYSQTFERLAINEPVSVRCLNAFSGFFPETNRDFITWKTVGLRDPPRFCKIENGIFGFLGRFSLYGVMLIFSAPITLLVFSGMLVGASRITTKLFRSISKLFAQKSQ